MIDYEKKYNEALERAKHALDCDKAGLVTTDRVLIESMFPELGESEDEKIRKALIDYFDDAIKADVNPLQSYGTHPNKVIDWLEKQGEQKATDDIQKPTDIKIHQGDKNNPYDMSFEEAQNYITKRDFAICLNDCAVYVDDRYITQTIANVLRWADDNPKQLDNKVEPKFKVGDWVVTSYGKVNQVIAVDKDGDGFTLDDGTYFSGSWKDNYHLWTIQDAKDGDVLVDDLGNICIYKESSLNSMYYSYCYGNYKYFVDGGGSHVIVDTCPSSKEQRNILFQKMKEEGYEWDAEKKELKKIDTVQPKFHEGDWVVYECGEETATLQITRIIEGTYEFSDDSTLNIADEDTLRLWNISDAKDGDVLAFSNDTIVIFKNLYNSTTFHSYCHIEDGVFNVSKDDVPDWWECKGFYPATKEQREILMKAMTDEGYQWDAEKKELKKIGESENIKNQIMSEITDLVKDYIRQKSTCDNEDGDIIIFSK